MDCIVVPEIPLQTRVGATEAERSTPQEVRIAITLHLDLARAGASDDLADTVDYDAVCATVEAVTGARPYKLVEALAESVASAVLDTFDVPEIEVRVEKPGALESRGVPFAAVVIRRSRDA